MKRCPFCTAEIPDEAAKCKHCAEWLSGRLSSGEQDREQTVNIRWEASESHLKLFKWFVIASAIGSLVFAVVFLMIFRQAWSEHEQFGKDADQRLKEMRSK